jgi:hypothetical protein
VTSQLISLTKCEITILKNDFEGFQSPEVRGKIKNKKSSDS